MGFIFVHLCLSEYRLSCSIHILLMCCLQVEPLCMAKRLFRSTRYARTTRAGTSAGCSCWSSSTTPFTTVAGFTSQSTVSTSTRVVSPAVYYKMPFGNILEPVVNFQVSFEHFLKMPKVFLFTRHVCIMRTCNCLLFFAINVGSYSTMLLLQA